MFLCRAETVLPSYGFKNSSKQRFRKRCMCACLYCTEPRSNISSRRRCRVFFRRSKTDSPRRSNCRCNLQNKDIRRLATCCRQGTESRETRLCSLADCALVMVLPGSTYYVMSSDGRRHVFCSAMRMLVRHICVINKILCN